MRQAARGKLCLGLGEATRFHVPFPSTNRIDRFLLVLGVIYFTQAVQRRDPSLKPTGHLANAAEEAGSYLQR